VAATEPRAIPVSALLHRSSALALSLAALAVARPARADQPSYFSTQAALSGGATMAIDRSGGAAWINPAGLADTGLTRVDLSATAFVLRIRDYARVVVSTVPSGTRPLDTNLAEIAPVPAALVFARPLGARVTAALGVFVTEADGYDIAGGFDSTEHFPGEPHPTRVSGRAQLSLIKQTYRIGPALGFTVSPRLRLGVGAYVVYASSRDSSNLTLDGQDEDGSQSPSLVSIHAITQRRNTWFGGQLVAGLQWNPGDGFHLGLALRSPVLGFASTGRVYQSTAALSSGTAFPGQSFTYLSDQPPVSAERRMIEPLSLTTGLAYQFPRGAIGIEGDLRLPIRVEAFDVDDRLQGNVRIGGQLNLSPRLRIGGGLFTDRSATRQPVITGSSRADYFGVSAAASFDSIYALAAMKPERNLSFLTVVSLRYAIGLAQLAALDYAPRAATLLELSALHPTTRSGTFHTIALQISSSVSF
jgi:long-subunit fatty acid transport protein